MNTKTVPVSLQTIIEKVKKVYPEDQALQEMFEKCFLNTWNTTLQVDDDGVFVITGDIPAMWLRDSSAQIRPYLIAAAEDQEVADVIRQVIERQWMYILQDPYANAFNRTASGKGHQSDRTDMSPWIWERKYEIDSLCFPLQLTWMYWKATGDQSILNHQLVKVIQAIIEVWKTEQDHENSSPYLFERDECRVSDTLLRDGKGGYSVKTGMTWSGFRPSDDACHYGYLIPANMFAVSVLGYAAEMLNEMNEMQLAEEAQHLAAAIRSGIETHGTFNHPVYGKIYAYETDGAGSFNLMDDANVPSLLSAPYLGYTSHDDPVYLNTRAFILSRDNPYYYEGDQASGIGSPHTPDHYIWHIALAMQGMTAADQAEKNVILQYFKQTHGGTGYMHEGFHADSPERFTREWFAWANSMFSEFVLSTAGMYVPGNPLAVKGE
ncbi:glycoside hydrolase family 125 protein [Jeotgalibacillus haloalkalitolerans]|uniref:Glycoside hydrolase family 125 protein n=1 Tax=Jeotgalibacillus haloalkalitolerans TaxID=3104292 RepID=A0ABU5KL33_9BACL|nr:glycoside hydrolase family 125 protein [Jeotgalibacillus sp. HH7-29]MDZ5711420.1 glycoside hydrolase family 125 protein [Jeotgalibacillus sp. HH7-29]